MNSSIDLEGISRREFAVLGTGLFAGALLPDTAAADHQTDEDFVEAAVLVGDEADRPDPETDLPETLVEYSILYFATDTGKVFFISDSDADWVDLGIGGGSSLWEDSDDDGLLEPTNDDDTGIEVGNVVTDEEHVGDDEKIFVGTDDDFSMFYDSADDEFRVRDEVNEVDVLSAERNGGIRSESGGISVPQPGTIISKDENGFYGRVKLTKGSNNNVQLRDRFGNLQFGIDPGGPVNSFATHNMNNNPMENIGSQVDSATFSGSGGYDVVGITDQDPGTSGDTNDRWIKMTDPDGNTFYVRGFR